MSPLTYILGWPLLAAFALAFVPRTFSVVMRAVAVGTTLISALLALKMFIQFNGAAAGYNFEQQIPWVESLGISYHVGADGINVGLILMGAIVAFAAACVSWEIKTREKEFYILLLVMTGGILGAFASLDLFFFYFFHELALVPTFIMIGVWGRGEQKNYATFQITLYLSIGALIPRTSSSPCCCLASASWFLFGHSIPGPRWATARRRAPRPCSMPAC